MTVKKLFSKIFILIIFVLFTNLLYSQTYYIHPSGIDAGEGNINSPFKTIEYALKYVSEQDVHTNTINIYIRQGVYHIAQSIQLNSNRSHINIQAYQDEEVIFSGGIPIPVSSIERISFSQTAYLPKREVLKIDLKKLGITDYGDIRNVGFARPYGASWGELFI
ncbi:MAG: hypothetical protein KAH25_06925, partial [Bacteroidales bacterium]|nr:hypothetical protein [Bacteroidales bacterium]